MQPPLLNGSIQICATPTRPPAFDPNIWWLLFLDWWNLWKYLWKYLSRKCSKKFVEIFVKIFVIKVFKDICENICHESVERYLWKYLSRKCSKNCSAPREQSKEARGEWNWLPEINPPSYSIFRSSKGLQNYLGKPRLHRQMAKLIKIFSCMSRWLNNR